MMIVTIVVRFFENILSFIDTYEKSYRWEINETKVASSIKFLLSQEKEIHVHCYGVHLKCSPKDHGWIPN
jgi:hypothetical protein